jgi:DNA processing protein
MAVPGSPTDPRHRGTNQLLREGAHLIENAADVLAVLGSMPERRPPPVRAARVPRSAPATRAATRLVNPAGLTDRVLAALGPAPLAVDELIRECDAATSEMQAVLLELELAGRIDRQPGNRVCLRAG